MEVYYKVKSTNFIEPALVEFDNGLFIEIIYGTVYLYGMGYKYSGSKNIIDGCVIPYNSLPPYNDIIPECLIEYVHLIPLSGNEVQKIIKKYGSLL